MANSSIINKAKNKIVKEFIKDDLLLQAIDSPDLDISKPEKYIGRYIFDFQQNPYTIEDVKTFLTVQVHIPEVYTYGRDNSKIFSQPTIEIWIISHERHMKVNNIPKVTANRNDYISMLIDTKLNGRDDFGIGKLSLLMNIEGAYQVDYVYRKMVFQGLDINNSLCDEE